MSMNHAQDPFHQKWREHFDPFGITDACWEVQKSWLAQPAMLTEELSNLTKKWVDLQCQSWRRSCGLQADDVFPAISFDERFQEPIWSESPYFDLLKQHYLLYTRWLEDAIEVAPGVPERTRRKASFWVRQWLNAMAPTNFFWTNPHAVFRYLSSGGDSVFQGLKNFTEDMRRGDVRMVNGESFKVGKNLANTPGKVVFRNELLELIQYTPTTEQVQAIPIVIVSPWINKYYILDLNEKKSLMRFLVSQGFTVFITSWKNPTGEMGKTTLDDYMLKGILQVMEVAKEITAAPHVHAAGYCIGGTMLSALMGWLNQGAKAKAKLPIGHFTLFTALVDFSAPGDIDVFIDEESVAYLEKKMADKGYLDGSDMTWSFRMLRSNSLLWHYVVHNYMYGEEPPQFDVLYWNTDSTRLPAAMHSFYLRELYMKNQLVKPGALTLGGRAIDLKSIKQPLYIVGTEQDHIAPWKETFKLCGQVKSPVRYVLATSGHILGIVNPPVDPPKRHFFAGDAAGHQDAEDWRKENNTRTAGSWWPDWADWLRQHCGALVDVPKHAGSERYPVLCDAPGTYVLEK